MNFIASCIFTACIDPQRNERWKPSFEVLKDWWESGTSICKTHDNIRLIIFYDELPKEIIEKLDNDYTILIPVEAYPTIGPYDYRWLIYNNFIKNNKQSIKNIFFTDISDVIINTSPFENIIEDTLYVGDETTDLSNNWIVIRTPYYLENVEDFEGIYNRYLKDPLLNCGIVGGSINIMEKYLEKMSSFTESTINKPEWITDMVNHNYVIRKHFDKIIHGAPVNSIFKGFELNRKDVWFIHK